MVEEIEVELEIEDLDLGAVVPFTAKIINDYHRECYGRDADGNRGEWLDMNDFSIELQYEGTVTDKVLEEMRKVALKYAEAYDWDYEHSETY